MEGRRRVLTAANGSLDASLLVIAEAPGVRGAEQSGIPLSDDRSGENFERLLASCGLKRSDLFVTNAVICNPQTGGGRNRAPRASELAACSHWLKAVIDLLDPPLIATLGAVALAALKRIDPHELSLAGAAGQAWPWHDRVLFPLYHPSPRVMSRYRRFPQQVTDWIALAKFVENLPALRTNESTISMAGRIESRRLHSHYPELPD